MYQKNNYVFFAPNRLKKLRNKIFFDSFGGREGGASLNHELGDTQALEHEYNPLLDATFTNGGEF